MLPFDDKVVEWRGEVGLPSGSSLEPPDGGIVLKNITHQQYHFAQDVRTIGFWITYIKTESTGSTVESRFYVLDRNNFTFQPVQMLSGADLDLKKQDPKQAADTKEYLLSTLMAFPYYAFTYAIRGIYKSKDGFFPPNCDMGSLTVNQSYLFTSYAAKPAHEPTGGLTAARFFPQISTHFELNKQFNKQTYPQYEVKSVRFDTRIQLALDTFVDTPSVPTSPVVTPNNFAAVFKDQEILKFGLKSAAKTIFEAAEKPLIFEMTARGFLHASNMIRQEKGWDNIHWWGARWKTQTIGAKTLIHISAPGAFFAVHFHWRWGGVARDKSAGPGSSDPQFSGKITPSGPLMDPKIPDQDLQFAIVKYDSAMDPDSVSLPNLSKSDFAKLFTGAKGTPDDISAGANIVMWVGASFNRTNPLDLLNGTQLVHGFFFAHNPEPGFFSKAGSTDAVYFPNDDGAIKKARKWERY